MNNFNAYYQSELSFLRESGKLFSASLPESAKYLSEPGSDPDVERILEGTAFLTARIRQRLDDGLPEVTQPLIEALLPHFLRTLPAITILQFSSVIARKDILIIPAGAVVDSLPLHGTTCRFRTTHAVHISPLVLSHIHSEPGPPTRIALTFKLPEGSITRGLNRVRLYLGDDPPAARALLLCLIRNNDLDLSVNGTSVPHTLQLSTVEFIGDESLFPHPSTTSDSHREMIDWFVFPQRFLELELTGLELSLPPLTTDFIVYINIKNFVRYLPPLGNSSFLLHTTPAVNIFPGEADPLFIDGRNTEHRVRPSGGDLKFLGIYSINSVLGRTPGSATSFVLERHWHRKSVHAATWIERRHKSVVGTGSDIDLLIENPPLLNGPFTLSLEVLCTNRNLPEQLGIGDIQRPSHQVPTGLLVRNITIPTASIEPSLTGDLHWRLLGHLSLDRNTLTSISGLRDAFSLYDLRAPVDQIAYQAHQRLTESLIDISSLSIVRLMDGIPIRGIAITVSIDEEHLGGVAEVQFLGSILDGFFSNSMSLNSFTRLTLICTRTGDQLTWLDRLGRKRLI